jgi:hypothetical protein
MDRVRRGITFANVVSLIALFVALGGGAYAAVKLNKNSVKSKHIAPEAVQGIDAAESTFGTVPRATSAVSADNAARVGGMSLNDLQFGNGIDDAIGASVDSGETAGIGLLEGGVGIACDATPELLYIDDDGQAIDTDLWVDGVYESVNDGDDATPTALSAADTAQVQLWGGDGFVAHVVASVVWDAGDTRCAMAFTAQENLESGFDPAQARGARARSARTELPAGWTD